MSNNPKRKLKVGQLDNVMLGGGTSPILVTQGLGFPPAPTWFSSASEKIHSTPIWESLDLPPHQRHRTTTMASRPTVSIATAEGKPSGATHTLPTVFNAPIRVDIVQYDIREVLV